MKNKFIKIKSWLLARLQIISFGLLILLIILVLKQQNDISNLEKRIRWLSGDLENVNEKLDDVESNLSNKIQDVIWSLDDVYEKIR